MNYLEFIDEYTKKRWEDIIDLIEIENDLEIIIKFPNDSFNTPKAFL